MTSRFEMVRALRRSQLGGTVLSLYGLQAANYLLPLVSFPYLTRTLGPEGFGVYVFVLVVARYLILITDYGFTYTATRDIAVARDSASDVSRIGSAVVVARLVLLGAMAIVVVILTTQVDRFVQDAALFWIAFAGGAGSALTPLWLFQGFDRLPLATGWSVAFRAIATVLIFILVQGRADLDVLLWLWSAPWLATAVVTLTLARTRLGVRLRRPTAQAVRRAFRDGASIFVAILASSLYLTSNALFLGLLTNNRQVGFFGTAESVIVGVKGLVDPISQALFPRAAQMGAQGREQALAHARRALRWIGGLGLLLALLTLAVAPILPVIVGAGFGPSVHILAIMSPIVLAQALIIVLGVHLMLPLRMDREYSLVVLLGGLVNVGLTLALVPLFEATGTAISVAVTETAIWIALALLLRRRALNVFRLT